MESTKNDIFQFTLRMNTSQKPNCENVKKSNILHSRDNQTCQQGYMIDIDRSELKLGKFHGTNNRVVFSKLLMQRFCSTIPVRNIAWTVDITIGTMNHVQLYLG